MRQGRVCGESYVGETEQSGTYFLVTLSSVLLDLSHLSKVLVAVYLDYLVVFQYSSVPLTLLRPVFHHLKFQK